MQHPLEKRHLPVVRLPESNSPVPQPPLLWVLCACIIIISLWVPLAMASLVVGSRIGHWLSGLNAPLGPAPSSPVFLAPIAGLVLFSFALACAVGGAVLGRFSERARWVDAALAGAGAVLVILVLAILGNALHPLAFGALVAVCLLALGPGSAVLGCHYARHRSAFYS
jgi:MFS family permease